MIDNHKEMAQAIFEQLQSSGLVTMEQLTTDYTSTNVATQVVKLWIERPNRQGREITN